MNSDRHLTIKTVGFNKKYIVESKGNFKTTDMVKIGATWLRLFFIIHTTIFIEASSNLFASMAMQWGKAMQSNRFQLLPDLSLNDCFGECWGRDSCKAFSYHMNGKWCNLHSASETDVPQDVVPMEGRVFSSKDAWTEDAGLGLACDCNSPSKCIIVGDPSEIGGCTMAECQPPQDPGDGIIYGNAFSVGKTVKLQCSGAGSAIFATCLNSGNWSVALLECPDSCSLSAPANMDIQPNPSLHGATVSFTCDSGYTLNGQATDVCNSGSLSNALPTCDPNGCTAIGPAQGSVAPDSVSHGDSVTYSCSSGYTLSGVAEQTCSLGVLSNSPPTCEPNGCYAVAPSQGSVTPSSVSHGDSVTYSCSSGYTLSGVAVQSCSLGVLSDSPPTCDPTVSEATSSDAVRIRIKGNDWYWQVSATSSERVKGVASLANTDYELFYFIWDQANQCYKIQAKISSKNVHSDGSVGNQLNTRWQSTDAYIRYYLELQGADSSYCIRNHQTGYVGLDTSDNILEGKGNFKDSYSEFYLELNGAVVRVADP